MKKLLFLLLITTLILACRAENGLNEPISENIEISDSSESVPMYVDNFQNDISSPQFEVEKLSEITMSSKDTSKITKEGNMHMEVNNLKVVKLSIDSIVDQNHGYYEKEIFINSKYNQNYDLKIRMPSANFDLLIEALESGVGTILGMNISTKDVTEEYVDLEIRLDNNKAYSQRYKMMLNKATNIKEMIAIQEKIKQIEKQIDSNIGRMNYLSNRVEYSTLSLQLTQIPEGVIAEAPPNFLDDINKALQNGYAGVLFLLIVLTNLWPIIVGLFIMILIRKRRLWFMKNIHAKV